MKNYDRNQLLVPGEHRGHLAVRGWGDCVRGESQCTVAVVNEVPGRDRHSVHSDSRHRLVGNILLRSCENIFKASPICFKLHAQTSSADLFSSPAPQINNITDTIIAIKIIFFISPSTFYL